MELRTLELRKPVAVLTLSTAALFGTATAATATSPSPSPTTTVTQEDDNDDNTGLWGLAGLLGLLGLAGLRGGKRRDHVDHVNHDRHRTDTLNRRDDHRHDQHDLDHRRADIDAGLNRPGTTGPDNTGARLGDVDRGPGGIDPTPGTGGPR